MSPAPTSQKPARAPRKTAKPVVAAAPVPEAPATEAPVMTPIVAETVAEVAAPVEAAAEPVAVVETPAIALPATESVVAETPVVEAAPLVVEAPAVEAPVAPPVAESVAPVVDATPVAISPPVVAAPAEAAPAADPVPAASPLAGFAVAELDKLVEAHTAIANQIGELSTELWGQAQGSLDDLADAAKALLAARTLAQLVDVQSTLSRRGIDRLVQGGSRLGQLGLKLATVTVAPISARIETVRAKFQQAA